MKFKLDLHVHSKYSTDNDAEPEETIQRAIELGLQGIAFTEHYYFGASEPIEPLREKYRKRIMIFRGVEFSAREGHCLIFGVDTDSLSLKYASLRDIIAVVSEKGGVVIPSHPYRSVNGMGDLVRNVNGICALEGYNGCNMHGFNVKAIEAATTLGIPFTGGSDAHTPQEVGACYTEFDNTVTEKNMVGLLKAGNYRGIDTRKISKLSLKF